MHQIDPKASDDHIRILFQLISVREDDQSFMTDNYKIIEFLDFACMYYFSNGESFNTRWLEFWQDEKKKNRKWSSERTITSSHGTLEKMHSRYETDSRTNQSKEIEGEIVHASKDMVSNRNVLGYLNRISSTNDTVLSLLKPTSTVCNESRNAGDAKVEYRKPARANRMESYVRLQRLTPPINAHVVTADDR